MAYFQKGKLRTYVTGVWGEGGFEFGGGLHSVNYSIRKSTTGL